MIVKFLRSILCINTNKKIKKRKILTVFCNMVFFNYETKFSMVNLLHRQKW